MASENVINLTNEDFGGIVLDSEMPVLVDFWASWCGPCRMVGPVIDELADDYAGKIKVGKVNIDEQEVLANKYNVMTIPTIALFKNGQIVDKIIGAVAKERFEDMIDKQF